MLVVKEVQALDRIVVTVDGEQYTITDLERQEVLPQVFLSCGRSGTNTNQGGYSRLAFEAPREIRIERVQAQNDSGYAGSSGVR